MTPRWNPPASEHGHAREHDGAVDVAVVGAGIIGLAIAWRAAAAGLRVAVLDPAPRHGASWVAAGMLAPVTEVHYGEETLLALNLASAARWPTFATELEEASGLPAGFDTGGTLEVAYDRDDREALAALTAYQRSLDLAVEPLTSREARRREPLLAPGISAATAVPGDHRADPRTTTAALWAAAERAGVVHVPERVQRIATDTAGRHVTGVTTASGIRVRAGAVVLAAAWESAALLADLPGAPTVPLRPVKGQILTLCARRATGRAGRPLPDDRARRGNGQTDRVATAAAAAHSASQEPRHETATADLALPRPADRPSTAAQARSDQPHSSISCRTPGSTVGSVDAGEPLLRGSVRALVEGSSVYLVPRRDGRVVVGATVEEQGADTTVTAGGVYELLRDASLVVPGISELELVEAIAGLRPATPDNAPVLGPTERGPAGLLFATGHFRNGVLLSAITADLVREMLANGTVPDLAAPFSPDRFANGSASVVAQERERHHPTSVAHPVAPS